MQKILQYIKILESTIVPPPTYFDFMQFDQNIRASLETDTDILIAKSDFL